METGFEHFHLKHELIENLKEKGYVSPTTIQNKSIPFIMNGENTIVQSATGSGKTFCYLAKILSNLEPGAGPQALVIAPTKDLVVQIGKEFEYFSKNIKANIVTTYGGVSYKTHQEEIYKADVIIGTTGRISDLVEQGAFELGKLQTIVMDEVDEMLHSQFLTELEFILKQCPKASQKLVFSATISKEANALIKHHIKGGKRISVDSYVHPKKLKQYLYQVESSKKYSLLVHLLNTETIGLAIIFCNRQDTAEWIGKNLKNHTDLTYQVVHGETGKGKRERTLQDFKDSKFDVLIATDIVSRGIDVEYISHIFNYNIPKDSNKYIHRVGRTARAGASGKVINLISETEVNSVVEILKEHQISPIPKTTPKFDIVETKKKLNLKKARR